MRLCEEGPAGLKRPGPRGPLPRPMLEPTCAPALLFLLAVHSFVHVWADSVLQGRGFPQARLRRSFPSPEDVFDSGLSCSLALRGGGQDVWKDFPWRSERRLGCQGPAPFQGVSPGGPFLGDRPHLRVAEKSRPSKRWSSHSHACFWREQGTV